MIGKRRKESGFDRVLSATVYLTGALALCWGAALLLNAIAGWFGVWGFLALIVLSIVLMVTGKD